MSFLKEFEHLKIRLEAIKSATNNFAETNRIGRGGFGNVYKGELVHSKGHTTVACKRLAREWGQGDREFWSEIVMLSHYKHENIVSLIGFCDDGGEKILVFEYASRSGLDRYLDNNDLRWVQRLKICIGAARGLAYLHSDVGTHQRVLHRDIKSSNILLDENWNARITDFGLSKISPVNDQHTFIITAPAGTMGYLDPVYRETGLITKESDVYSFGVVLFEVLCGRLCFRKEDDRQPFTEWVQKCYKQKKLEEIIYGNIKDEIAHYSLEEFATIAYRCLKQDPEDRPLMNDVVTKLEAALRFQIFTEGTRIPLRDIELATNYFKSKCIGVGGYGKVYMGELVLSEGSIMTVAVKRLNATDEQGNRGFEKERRLSKYRHGNIVNLLGYCNDGNEMILVYEYAANRSLDYQLKNSKLRWLERLNICIGAARGLEYLHKPDKNQESVWHLDIKSGNILLDETWNAKITDFGLSKFGVANQGYKSPISGAIVGTPGYCDPVYMETGLPTKESDIYSFGMVLFEVLCGRLNPPNKYEHRSLAELTRSCYEKNDLNGIIFGNIKDEINPSSLRAFVTVAYRCLKRDREERPSMKEILIALETALECQVSPLHLTPPPTPSSNSSNEYQRSLKPLYWETSHTIVGSLWDVSYKHGNQYSRAPEIDITELESLFRKHKDKLQPSSENPEPEGLGLVHPDRARRCKIMLQDIKLPLNDIIDAILALDSSALSVDQVYDLNEFCPTNEEMEKLKSYTGDEEELGECEKFYLECAKIPRIDTKLQVFAFTITFSRRVNNFNDTLKIIKNATKEIRESTKLAKILQIILRLGNKLNAGTSQESLQGFILDSLERLGYTWATENEITLLHFLCKVVAKQTPELLDFYKDLIHLQDAYWVSTQNHNVQIRGLYEDRSAIIKGLEKVKQEFDASANDDVVSAQFQMGLKRFLDSIGADLLPLISFDELVQYADSLVTYFGEDPNRYSWKQVITSLVCFIEMFKKAHNQNKLQLDAEQKKMEAAVEQSLEIYPLRTMLLTKLIT